MRLHILGGGHEVGASMLLVETGESRVVVDCGVRVNNRASALPDLAGLGDRKIDAIFLTHAHLDHCGALPLLHASMQQVPIYCTAPTRDIVKVMLLDALRVMEERMAREQELPLYPPEAVEATVARMQTLPFGATVRVGRREKTAVRLMPAGHILGAAMASVEDPEGSLLVTGDVSLADQDTVAGLAVPADRYHAVVAESTYGGRLHADRFAEAERFLAKVREVVGRGGKLLVPAFALGRAQELLLTLIKAFRKGTLAPMPVWADGLVREVCRVYSRHGLALAPQARRLQEKFGNPFFGVLENVRPVTEGNAQRDAVMAGPPCVIVSSSGMLTGGPSVYYMQRLSGNPANCVALTGYQDEESPGRRLQELASQFQTSAGNRQTGTRGHSLDVPGGSLSVQCEVATYGLSAHIDGQEMLQLLRRLEAAHVVLVHGDGDARSWLADRAMPAAAHLPRNGEVVEIPPARGRANASGGKGPSAPSPGSGRGETLSVEKAPLLAADMRRAGLTGRRVELSRILDRWYGAGLWGEEAITSAREILAASPHFQAPESGRREVFLVVSEEEVLAAVAQSMGPMPQHRVSETVANTFAAGSGLRRTGLYTDERRVLLSFDFPVIAARVHSATLRQLESTTGWKFEVDPSPNLGAMLELVQRLLTAEVPLVKLGFNPTEERFQAKVSGAVEGETGTRARQVVLDATGYDVTFSVSGAAPLVSSSRDGQGRLEINAAFARIDAAFADAPVRLLRRGKRSDSVGFYIELRFVTPEAAARYAELVGTLSYELGWRIEVCRNVSPQELQRLAIECLPPSHEPTGVPGIFPAAKKVRVQCRKGGGGPPSPASGKPDSSSESASLFRELTGWELEILAPG